MKCLHFLRLIIIGINAPLTLLYTLLFSSALLYHCPCCGILCHLFFKETIGTTLIPWYSTMKPNKKKEENEEEAAKEEKHKHKQEEKKHEDKKVREQEHKNVVRTHLSGL